MSVKYLYPVAAIAVAIACAHAPSTYDLIDTPTAAPEMGRGADGRGDNKHESRGSDRVRGRVAPAPELARRTRRDLILEARYGVRDGVHGRPEIRRPQHAEEFQGVPGRGNPLL